MVKEAEQQLLETQVTKAYLGSAGDKRFAELLRPILLGEHADDERIAGPPDAGRLRRACASASNSSRRQSRGAGAVGTPTWPNHPPIMRAVGLEVVEYPYYERGQGAIRFDDMLDALSSAEPGDVALLHGCCHNPTGADLDREQWREVTRRRRGARTDPVVDLAYQGFGRGLDEDARGARG